MYTKLKVFCLELKKPYFLVHIYNPKNLLLLISHLDILSQ
jgi:hypothetical protein